MSALFMDGFDQYGTGTDGAANMLDGVYAQVGPGFSVNPPSWGAARTGSNSLTMRPTSIGTAVGNELRYVVPGAPAVMYMSYGFAVDQLPPYTNVSIFQTRDAGNVLKYQLMLNPTGSLSLYNGAGTLVASTAGPVIRAQTWHLIELCVNYTTGVFTLRVDDADVSQAAAITTSISTSIVNGIVAFTWNNVGGDAFGNYYFDDLFIRNSSGSVNNGFLGDRRVATLFANVDTATAGWTPTYYQKFGTGVLRTAYMVSNNNTPVNANACVTTAGTTSLDPGTNDFTMESFVRFEKLPNAAEYASIFSRWDAAVNKRQMRLILGGSSFNNSSLQFDYSTDGTASGTVTPIVYQFAPVLNQWYHIAIVRASGQLLLFVDGQQLGLPISAAAGFFAAGTAPYTIGGESTSSAVVANTYLTGMFDETRYTNGFARYTTSFAVPSAAFTRGSGDPQWANVALLAGYDSAVQDESSFTRTLSPQSNAIAFQVADGAGVGVFSTVNKPVPDDNTFISASLTPATNIFTMTAQPTAGNTVTVGTKNGSTAAVYTFRASISTAFDVLIDTTAQNTLLNLIAAINAGAGAGVKYGTSTTANFDVVASQLPAGQIKVTALTAGTAGNSIASTETGPTTSWATTSLTGGANIPGPTAFVVQRPPANTTIISAVQPNIRAFKSDSGTSTIQSALVGPLGAVTSGATHNLAISPDYYTDIIETDPDTSGPITPATLVNGKIRINRTA